MSKHNNKGILYWITGLAGSGKTTIGTRLYYRLRENSSRKVVILDGDILKEIVGDNIGYSYEDRLKRARKYSNLCKFLVDQGIDVIICTIAMFDSVREWNRKNIEKYIEVFLNVDEDVLRRRNKKGLYEADAKDVVGRDVSVELPKNPDVVIDNNGDFSVEECVNQIINCTVNINDTYNRDTEYWNKVYQSIRHSKPSLFAEFIANNLKPGETIMDLGCGDGRDSEYFIEKGLYVIGIDASDVAINNLKKMHEEECCEFICDDFVASKILYVRQIEHCYSRFTLHAISETQEDILLQNVYTALKSGGRFYVEARSIHDEIYGKGLKVDADSYIYNGHFRRFIDVNKLREKCENLGFEIEYCAEDRGFAPYKDENPILVRLICKKL